MLTGELHVDTVRLRDLVLAATLDALRTATSRLPALGGVALSADDSGAQVHAMANGLTQVRSDVEFLFGNWSVELLAVAGTDPSDEIAGIEHDSIRLLSHPDVWARLQAQVAKSRSLFGPSLRGAKPPRPDWTTI